MQTVKKGLINPQYFPKFRMAIIKRGRLLQDNPVVS
jgi:hypothetical protein